MPPYIPGHTVFPTQGKGDERLLLPEKRYQQLKRPDSELTYVRNNVWSTHDAKEALQARLVDVLFWLSYDKVSWKNVSLANIRSGLSRAPQQYQTYGTRYGKNHCAANTYDAKEALHLLLILPIDTPYGSLFYPNSQKVSRIYRLRDTLRSFLWIAQSVAVTMSTVGRRREATTRS